MLNWTDFTLKCDKESLVQHELDFDHLKKSAGSASL